MTYALNIGDYIDNINHQLKSMDRLKNFFAEYAQEYPQEKWNVSAAGFRPEYKSVIDMEKFLTNFCDAAKKANFDVSDEYLHKICKLTILYLCDYGINVCFPQDRVLATFRASIITPPVRQQQQVQQRVVTIVKKKYCHNPYVWNKTTNLTITRSQITQ